MMKRRIDEDRASDPLFARLKKRPFQEKRYPAEQRIAAIADRVANGEPPRKRTRRLWLGWSGAAVACFVLLCGFIYLYDTPGGIADWRYSRAAGFSETVSVPLGRTPEEAVLKFRRIDSMQVLHKESIDGGVLLFIKRNYEHDGTDLQLEFVRKTWLGWKWVMGGMYGLSVRSETEEALNYMSMPKFGGIQGPFPIVFGQLTNPSVAGVNVTIGGEDAGVYAAKMIEYAAGRKIWFAALPKTAAAPYGIDALDAQGAVVASKAFDDPTASGSVLMRKNRGDGAAEEQRLSVEDVTKALEQANLSITAYGSTGSTKNLNQVKPDMYGIALKPPGAQGDEEFIYLYPYPSDEARIQGMKDFNAQYADGSYAATPYLYARNNMLAVYWGKTQDSAEIDRRIKIVFERL